MTKEEILEKQFMGLYEPDRLSILDCMQEYADQQTTEKNSEIEILKAELNELKERHKKDAEQTLSLKAEHAIEKLKIYQECNEAQCKLLKTISEFKNKIK